MQSGTEGSARALSDRDSDVHVTEQIRDASRRLQIDGTVLLFFPGSFFIFIFISVWATLGETRSAERLQKDNGERRKTGMLSSQK